MSDGPDSGTVLVVDDLQDYLDLYERRLSDEFTVLTAIDGETALEIGGPDVDVVLLDRDMPGMRGAEVLERIRDADYECRVAMVTAEEPDENVVELGYDAYLQKPVSGPELSSTVERLLRLTEYGEAVSEFHAACERRQERLKEDGADLDAVDDTIQAHRERVDELATEFDTEDYLVVFRNLC